MDYMALVINENVAIMAFYEKKWVILEKYEGNIILETDLWRLKGNKPKNKQPDFRRSFSGLLRNESRKYLDKCPSG